MKIIILAPILTLAIFIAGCGTTITETTPARTFNNYPATGKINLNVGLVLTPEYRATKCEDHPANTTVRFPIGDNVTTNSESMASQLFNSVQVLDAPVAPAGSNINVFLIPQENGSAS